MDFQRILQDVLLFAPVFILSLSIHEWAHAAAANTLGDSTAKYMGRLTFDPMAHISWMGTVVFPLMSIAFGGIFFGWAKPVPVDMRNFRRPRQHMAMVALAGPVSNVVLALICTLILAIALRFNPFALVGMPQIHKPFLQMVNLGIMVNLTLAAFNMLPLPPLDGSKVLQGLVKPRMADQIDGWAQQAQFLLILLLFTGALRVIMGPLMVVHQFLLALATT